MSSRDEQPENYAELWHYLASRPLENLLLLSELAEADRAQPTESQPDELTLFGYRYEGELVAVQGISRSGRCLPHLSNEIVIPAMLADLQQRPVRWLIGMRRVVDPLLQGLLAQAYELYYDEQDHLCQVTQATLQVHTLAGVRRATENDLQEVARLRCRFESEYFGVPQMRIPRSWCIEIARRYLHKGVYLAMRDGHAVAMATLEARYDDIAQVGAVYTEPAYRGQGLAKAVVSAICQELLLTHGRVTLTVRQDNAAARAAYTRLGFVYLDDFRMVRLA